MTLLQLCAVSKRFGSTVALDGVELDVRDGELLCIVGPTNAGKSTLLKVIAGLHRPDAGSVLLRGQEIDTQPPHARGVGFVFQGNALFQDRSGFENIAFPLRAAGRSAQEVGERVREIARLLRIEHILDRLPDTFSGGEQKRVAIGRAIAGARDLLLMDEPLSSLDAQLRVALRLELKRLRSRLARAILYVTHDYLEAMSLGDRVVVLDQGRIQQIGTPQEVYRRPINRFVAGFFGNPPMNLLDLEQLQEAEGGPLRLDGVSSLARDVLSGLQLGVRAEDVRVAPAPSALAAFRARVAWVERLGARNVLELELRDVRVRAVVHPEHPAREGQEAWVSFAPGALHVLERESGRFVR